VVQERENDPSPHSSPFPKGRRGLLHPPLGVVATLAETKALPFTDATAQGIRLSPFCGEDEGGGGSFRLAKLRLGA